MEKKIKSLESEIRILKSIYQKEKYSVKHDIKFCKKYTKDIFELIIQKLKEERRKSLYYEKDIERLKKDLSYLERINKDYSGSSFKLNLEPFKSIMNIHEKTDNNVKQVEEKPKVSKYHKKKYEKENHSKKIGVENVHGSTVFLSPIKPADEDEEDIKKLEISEIEKESMEIERRINKLKEKSKKYGREYSGRKIIQ